MKIRTCLIIFLLLIIQINVFASVEYTSDQNNDGEPDQWFVIEEGIILRIDSDRNYDGIIDHILIYNDKGIKEYEELDYNYDGIMDDFYYFEDGQLSRREIDSNYDEQIDIWVELEDGKYIKRMEQDTDFDGERDVIKEY